MKKLSAFLGIALLATAINAKVEIGTTVEVPGGVLICYSTKADNALSNIQTIDNAVSNGSKIKVQMKDGFCLVNSQPTSGKVTKYYNGKYVLLDTKDYWLVTYTDSIGGNSDSADNNTQDDNNKYNFVGIDDVESFPSDYVGKRLYLECKDTQVEEDDEGGYEITASCLKSDGSYDFMNNPFKMKIHINDKATAKALAKNKRGVKYLLGTVRTNNADFALAKYIFEIDSVQFK